MVWADLSVRAWRRKLVALRLALLPIPAPTGGRPNDTGRQQDSPASSQAQVRWHMGIFQQPHECLSRRPQPNCDVRRHLQRQECAGKGSIGVEIV